MNNMVERFSIKFKLSFLHQMRFTLNLIQYFIFLIGEISPNFF
jgi:hypothetical protein